MDERLESVGVTEEVLDKAMGALVDDLAAAAETQGVHVVEMLDGWHDEISGAYFFGYTQAVLAGKEGEDLTVHAATSILYALNRSEAPEARERGRELRRKLAGIAYLQINSEARKRGEDPTFGALPCSECVDGHYRDDQEPRPEWGDVPEARWRCVNCGRPVLISDLVLETGEVWAIRDHVLGIVRPVETLEKQRDELLREVNARLWHSVARVVPQHELTDDLKADMAGLAEEIAQLKEFLERPASGEGAADEDVTG